MSCKQINYKNGFDIAKTNPHVETISLKSMSSTIANNKIIANSKVILLRILF